MPFLRNLLATIVGLFIFSFMSFFFFIAIISAVESDEAPVVKDKTLLYLPLGGIVREQAVDDPLEELFPNSGAQILSLKDVVKGIKNAAYDDKVIGLYIEPRFVQSGFAALQEIRDAILEFKESGKPVYAYGEFISEVDYFVVSTADRLFMHPEGTLEFNGMTARVTFFKGLFDKLGIQPEIFRVGEFKAAVEPFMQKSMSDENRLQLTGLLESIHGHYLEEVSTSRNIPIERLEQISDQMEAYLPKESLEVGLVDRLAFEDEIKEEMMELAEVERSRDLNFMSVKSYVKASGSDYSRDRVAVILAEGEIIMGNSDEQVIAAERFAREMRRARENNRIKAVVLRINSPGGSMTASDIIWREIQLTKKKKPIIASMGNYAASGGYYLAMEADTIVAQPTTITGSIGVFAMLLNVEEMLENKLGITNDVVTTGEYSDIISITRTLDDYERQVIQRGVDQSYQTFLQKVANGRGMEVSDVEKVAGGRVWSGKQALEYGLVDALGGLDLAVELAAQSANLVEYQVTYYPVQKPFFEEFVTRISDETEALFRGKYGSLMNQYATTIKSIERMEGIQLRMPMELEVN